MYALIAVVISNDKRLQRKFYDKTNYQDVHYAGTEPYNVTGTVYAFKIFDPPQRVAELLRYNPNYISTVVIDDVTRNLFNKNY